MSITLLAEASADMDDEIDLTWAGEYDTILLRSHYVTADIQPGALLTAFLSDDGISFDQGANYYNEGLVNWYGEPNPVWWPQPVTIGAPQTLSLGCRIGIDVGERAALGIHAMTHFTAMGTLNGTPVSPNYLSYGHAGFIGGAAGISPRAAHAGGGVWFPDDPHGQPFDWQAQVQFAGHQNAPGSRIQGIRLRMDGGGQFDRKIEQGYFRVEAIEPMPLPPEPFYTIVGNLSAPAYAFNGNYNKAAGGGSCSFKTSANSLEIGKLWNEPFRPSKLGVYPSNDAGFTNAAGTPQVTVTAYFTDNGTDWVFWNQKTVPDGNYPGTKVEWFPAPIQPHLGWKFKVEHTGAASSMYIAQAHIK